MRINIHWFAKVLPEDWLGELEALRNKWCREGQSKFLTELITVLCLLDMLKARIQIGVRNAKLFRYFIITIIFIGVVIGTSQTNEFNSTFLEQKINQEEFTALCNKNSENSMHFLNSKSDFPKGNIISGELVLASQHDNYPVYRWTCEYKIRSNNKSNDLKFRSGLDLNRYCQETYKNRGLDKASYHNFKDPYSWYCINSNVT